MSSSTNPPHKTPAGFNIRNATINDVDEMSDLFFTSFTPSHKFWQYLMPDDATNRQWWRDAWRLGIEEDPTAVAFVVEDPAADNKLVGFSRWIVPQKDLNLERIWPEFLKEWDQELSGAFFGGMAENRAELVGKEPHWMLEMLGVDQDYQRRGIAEALVEWGCSQADKNKMKTYLDASEKGLPFYKKHFGFEFGKLVIVPDRPAFGKFVYTSVVRPTPGDAKA